MHRKAEQRRRWRLWERNERKGYSQALKERLDACKRKSSAARSFVLKNINKDPVRGKVGAKAFCQICGSEGVIMEKFPRRGYGKSIGRY